MAYKELLNLSGRNHAYRKVTKMPEAPKKRQPGQLSWPDEPEHCVNREPLSLNECDPRLGELAAEFFAPFGNNITADLVGRNFVPGIPYEMIKIKTGKNLVYDETHGHLVDAFRKKRAEFTYNRIRRAMHKYGLPSFEAALSVDDCPPMMRKNGKPTWPDTNRTWDLW